MAGAWLDDASTEAGNRGAVARQQGPGEALGDKSRDSHKASNTDREEMAGWEGSMRA